MDIGLLFNSVKKQIEKNTYQKPQLKSKKIKISFFLSKVSWLDGFNAIGTVYAQSGGSDNGGWGGCATNDCGHSATPD